MTDMIFKYNMLDEGAKKQLNDFIDFLLSKKKHKKPDLSEYYNRIQTVSQWSDKDVEYLREMNNHFNWNIEEW